MTYDNKGNQSQIHYILTRKEQKRLIKDSKFIIGEVPVVQHRMVVSDIKLARKKRKANEKKRKDTGLDPGQ